MLQGFDYGSDGTTLRERRPIWRKAGTTNSGNLEAMFLNPGDDLFFEWGTGLYEINPTYINGELASLNAVLLTQIDQAYAVNVHRRE